MGDLISGELPNQIVKVSLSNKNIRFLCGYIKAEISLTFDEGGFGRINGTNQ